MNTKSHSTSLWPVVLGALLAVGWSAAAEPPQAVGPSETIAFAAYASGEGRVRAAVGSAIADTVKSDDLLPLQIAISVWGEGPELRFTLDSFALMDAAGNVYRVADPKAVAERLGVFTKAQNYLRQRPMPIGAIIRDSAFVRSEFYNKGGTIWGGTYLSSGNHTQDVIFFPRPRAGLGGVLTLRVLTEGMSEPVEVRFEIPGQKKKKKDKKHDQDEP